MNNMSLLEQAKVKKVKQVNPREMIIFSYPKVGKTELFSHLPGSYLIIDFDGGGADFIDAHSITINDMGTFNELSKEFIETNTKIDYIVLDTITSLYNKLVNQVAISSYNTKENKNLDLNYDITNLAYGVGYAYKRNALQKIIEFFKKYTNKCLILSGHVSDKAMGSVDGDSTVKDLDFEGKLKNILALKTDAMGLLTRSNSLVNTNILSFKTSAGMIGGTRSPHLSNKEIVISEKQEDDTLVTHWDRVFI